MTVSAIDALRGAIGKSKASTLDAAILDYMVEMLSDESMNHDDLCESLSPLLIDTECAKDEGSFPSFNPLLEEAQIVVRGRLMQGFIGLRYY